MQPQQPDQPQQSYQPGAQVSHFQPKRTGHWKKRHLLTALAFGVSFGGLGTYLLSPSSAQTATSMYLAPASANVTVNSTFSVAVRINAGEPINAVTADLTYNSSQLQFLGINSAGSAFSTEAPSSGGSGSISINRGQIGGVSGDNLVATVSFKALTANAASSVNFANSSQALRNADNTDALSAATGGSYALAAPAPAPAPAPPAAAPSPSPVAKPTTPTSKTPSPAPAATPTPASPTPATPPAATPAPAGAEQAPIPTTTTFEKEESGAPLQIDTKKTGAKAAIWGMAGLVMAAGAVAGTVFFRHRHGYVPVNHAIVMGDTPSASTPSVITNSSTPATTTVKPEAPSLPKDPPVSGQA